MKARQFFQEKGKEKLDIEEFRECKVLINVNLWQSCNTRMLALKVRTSFKSTSSTSIAIMYHLRISIIIIQDGYVSFEDFSHFLLNYDEEDYDEEHYLQTDEANMQMMDDD